MAQNSDFNMPTRRTRYDTDVSTKSAPVEYMTRHVVNAPAADSPLLSPTSDVPEADNGHVRFFVEDDHCKQLDYKVPRTFCMKVCVVSFFLNMCSDWKLVL